MRNYQIATLSDLDEVWALRLEASDFLKTKGVDQWQFEDPTQDNFRQDILENSLFVYKENNEIIGMFALKIGVEPTYATIDGAWNHHKPYTTIHRIALRLSEHSKGIALDMLKYAEIITKQKGIDYMRIDTHEKNIHAQKLFLQSGYVYCGKIMLDIKRGERLRLAYDKLLEA